MSKMMILMMLLAISNKDMDLTQVDVKIPFLHKNLEGLFME